MKNQGVEYQMPKALANSLLAKKKPSDKDTSDEYLRKYVNAQYGLIRNCTKVILY